MDVGHDIVCMSREEFRKELVRLKNTLVSREEVGLYAHRHFVSRETPLLDTQIQSRHHNNNQESNNNCKSQLGRDN
jgi:hypothetical protein